jgi:hypothetical protein
MESDFTTRQHMESLTPMPDPSLAEVMNKYKFPPIIPTPQPQPMGGYPQGHYGPPQGSSNNDMLLGNILGQLQSNTQKQNTNGLDGFQLNINMEILRWLLLIILLAVLIWLIFRVQQKKKNPLKKRLRKLEKEFKRMRKHRRKNPKALEVDLDEVDELDALDLKLEALNDDFDD